MGWIKHLITSILMASALSACAGSEGAPTHSWEVTALNGDKMIGCLAVDVKPDMIGYYDLSQFPDFSLETFEALEVDYDTFRRTGETRVELTHMKGSRVKGYPDPEKLRRKCNHYPLPESFRKRDYLFGPITAPRITTVEYRLYEEDGKFIFVDAYTSENECHNCK